MRSICFYSSFFNQPVLPYYIRFYLENILPYFSELVFITNEKALDAESIAYLNEKKIRLMPVKNEGWDFGMWYKAFRETDVTVYDRIGLINDSCILFTKPAAFFEWLEKSDLDYCGMTDSNAIAYHVQSFFVIVNKNAIAPVADYFKMQGIIENVKDVIITYEVGLSQYLAGKGLKTGVLYSTKEYSGEFSPMFYMADTLIGRGLPLIKKKIIFSSFRKDEHLNLMRMKFRINPGYYIQLIRDKYKNDPCLIDFKKVQKDSDLSSLSIWKFSVFSFFFQLIRQFKFLKRS